jgi:bifunctional DNA-binding transcriptional regulator/antitoxin component of YhaV-PrlF toxin-antitoxin module
MQATLERKIVPMSRQSQVTVPKFVRSFIGVQPGQNVTFQIEGDNVVVKRAPSYKDFIGKIKFDLDGLDAAEYIRRDRDESR